MAESSSTLEGVDKAKRFIFQVYAEKEVHFNIERDFTMTDHVGIFIKTNERATFNIKRDMIIGANTSPYPEKLKVSSEQGLENSDRNADESHVILKEQPDIHLRLSLDCSEASRESNESLSLSNRQTDRRGSLLSDSQENNEKESNSEDQGHYTFTLIDPNFSSDMAAGTDDHRLAGTESGYYSRPGEFIPLSQITNLENPGNPAEHRSLAMRSKIFHDALQKVCDLHSSNLIHGNIHAGNILSDGMSIELQDPENGRLSAPAGKGYVMLRDDVLQMFRCILAWQTGITFENVKDFEKECIQKMRSMNAKSGDDMAINAGILVMKAVLNVYTVYDERRLLNKLLTMKDVYSTNC